MDLYWTSAKVEMKLEVVRTRMQKACLLPSSDVERIQSNPQAQLLNRSETKCTSNIYGNSGSGDGFGAGTLEAIEVTRGVL